MQVIRRAGRDRLITVAFSLLALGLAFWQRPGWATSDTKIDLHVDPARFLDQVASVWTSTTDLGEVHSAQYSGYLWPMGPFFSLLHSIGLGAWVVERLWLALMLGLAVWGILRLLDELIGRPRGVAHIVAGAFYLMNPYVVVFTARTTITLLGYAALPWLLLVTLHGVRQTRSLWRGWRGWWWAAAFALILTSTGGGVNAAVVGWMLVGPLVLLLYEPAIGGARWRDSGGFLVRVGIVGVLASLWWIMPLLVHVRYGIDFLQFTEQPASIWGTNSITESLRLMGYWTSYIGVGFGTTVRPFFTDSGTLLFNPLVVGAGLLLPALAVAGFVSARRYRYAPLMLALVVVGVVIMMAGFPDGTPLRGGMTWAYRHIFVLRFMRTTNKAAPLVATGVAGLLGLGAAWLLTRLRALRIPWLRIAAPAGAAAVLIALLVLASLPLVRGRAIDTQLQWKRIPAAWMQAGHELDHTLPVNTRAAVLPGQIFGYYTWGGTLDAILPRLTSRPVAVRYETPYSDLRAVDLLTTTDDLVQQRRLVPGQLIGLLRFLGAGAVVSGADDDISRSGAIDPAAAAGVLDAQLGSATRNYGPVQTHAAAAGDATGAVRLPEVRRYPVSGARGIVHVDPAGPPTIVDGGAQGLADLAAFGGLPREAPVLYAADQSRAGLRRSAAQGANLVITDSNRRREFLPESTQQNRGTTLQQTEPLPTGAAVVNPFAAAGTSAQTVSLLSGARYLRAPAQAGELQFPEHAPIAAFDGDLSSSWVANRYLPTFDRWIEIGLNSPRDVPYVDVYPLSDTHGVVTEVDVNGVHHAVRPGWTRIPVNLRRVSVIRVRIDHVVQPKLGLGGPGGFREIRIPGVHVSELLRPPVVSAAALAGTDLRRDSLSYLFERTTGDDPFRRNPYGTSTLLDSPKERGDAERYIDRLIFAPAARRYSADAWVYPAVGAPDSALDRLAGMGAETFNSSARFQDQPAYRASSAFDGTASPGWVGVWIRPQGPPPWISWTLPRALRFSRLRLSAPGLPVRRPTVVRLSWSGGQSPPLRVAAGGIVTLPQAVSGRAFRVTVLGAAFPPGLSARQRQVNAVGIGAVQIAGMRPVNVPRSGPIRSGCGAVAIALGSRRVPLAVTGTVTQLDSGTPLRAHSCGSRVPLGAGTERVRALRGTFSIDLLRLSSPASAPPAWPVGGGRLIAPGSIGQSSVSGVRVSLKGPSWLVLGESFDVGWRASCDGHSLGAPVPVDGYASGWIAPASCRAVSFSFAPQSGVRTSYIASGIACLGLLVFLLVGAWRRPRAAHQSVIAEIVWPTVRQPMPLALAALIAIGLAIPIGTIFALRAGAVSFPLLTFVLWRGFGIRQLTLAAAALLGVVVPVVYAITAPRNEGGYNFEYSTKLIGAHWVGVTAIVLLGLVVGRSVSAVRARRGSPPPPSFDDRVDQREQHSARPVEQEVVRS